MKEKKPVRVLHVLTGLSSGGAESFIMNMYRNIDRNMVQFDFLLRSNVNIFRDELEQMGSQVYITDSFPGHFIKNAIQTSSFFKKHHYDIIHVHANALLYTWALICAKRDGVKCRIIHSHNAAMAHMILLPIHKWNKRRICGLATDFFACSDDAGRWMFPEKYTVIPNAIDLHAFSFNQNKREEVRKRLGIGENELVLGHIGRFAKQKNHTFLLDIFSEVAKKRPDSRLVLVGDGELRQEIEEKALRLNLKDRVLFLGARADVADIVNCFDVFVFPSIYEGLGIVVIEAQANGLCVISSEAVPDQAVFSDIQRLSIQENAAFWAGQILQTDIRRKNVADALTAAGFDVQNAALKLQEFYLSKAK